MSQQQPDTGAPVLADPADIEIEILGAPPVKDRGGRIDTPQRRQRVGDRATLDERRGFLARCERLATSLASATGLGERIELYKGRTWRELSTASALCPDLMPLLNGEFEWLVLQSPDVLD